jgi:molybdate/tungstate transport system substrate-binding protein
MCAWRVMRTSAIHVICVCPDRWPWLVGTNSGNTRHDARERSRHLGDKGMWAGVHLRLVAGQPGLRRRSSQAVARRLSSLNVNRCRHLWFLPLVVCVVALAACSSSSKTSTPTTSSATTPATSAPAAAPTTAAKGSGPVDVLYAGSLVNQMEKQIGPAFNSATGYTFQGFSAGSKALATQIKGKVRQGDVFISASPAVNATLTGPTNGDWVSWYVTYATSPLVLGYNPHSKFAHDLQTMPWYQVITQPGFLIGRTDPATDPKGVLTVTALDGAAVKYKEPKLHSIATDPSTIYPEETLVGRLQAGQLDAGFFYTSEAKAANIPTVPLTGETEKATYTITILNRAPHQAGAEAFVNYYLGPAGTAVLKEDAFTLVTPPKVTGTGIPASVQSTLAG